jgi:hypothetical protein
MRIKNGIQSSAAGTGIALGGSKTPSVNNKVRKKIMAAVGRKSDSPADPTRLYPPWALPLLSCGEICVSMTRA